MMNAKPKIVRRGKLVYLLYPDKVIVGAGLDQWISYNPYDNWNRQGITAFKKKIANSREDEYGTAYEQIALARECDIKGFGTKKPVGVEV